MFVAALDTKILPHDATQSAVMRQYVACPSIRLSVRLWR